MPLGESGVLSFLSAPASVRINLIFPLHGRFLEPLDSMTAIENGRTDHYFSAWNCATSELLTSKIPVSS